MRDKHPMNGLLQILFVACWILSIVAFGGYMIGRFDPANTAALIALMAVTMIGISHE